MTESDDASSITSAPGGIFTGGKVFGGFDLFDADDSSSGLPSQQATQPKKTATALRQESEATKESKRLRASTVTRGFAPVRLGERALLGVSPGV